MAGVDDGAGRARLPFGRRRPGTAPPPRSASASPRGRCAAACRRTSAASRSSETARCAPRLFGATAWISSTMTVRVVSSILPARFRAEQDVERFRASSRRYAAAAAQRAGALALRRVAGAHPAADLDVGQAPRSQHRRGCRRAALRGSCGCRSTAPSAARHRRSASRRARPPASPWRTSPSIAARNAASVLPEPVGAAISTWRPAWIAGQASACAAVGAQSCARTTRRRRDERMRSAKPSSKIRSGLAVAQAWRVEARARNSPEHGRHEFQVAQSVHRA